MNDVNLFSFQELTITLASSEEYIGHKEVVTGLSYFVHNYGSTLNPYLVPSPDFNTLKENIQLTSYKMKVQYDLYDGVVQKYESTYSLYIIGQVSLEEAPEIIASVVDEWRTHTSDPSTQLTMVNVETAVGNYG